MTRVLFGGVLCTVLAACSSEPIARPMDDNPPSGKLAGCYVDIYQNRDFKGVFHRVWGPGVYQSLEFNGKDYRNIISSVIAGPNSYVRLNDGDERENHSIWLVPGMRVSDLSKQNFEDKIKLIEIRDHAPDQTPMAR